MSSLCFHIAGTSASAGAAIVASTASTGARAAAIVALNAQHSTRSFSSTNSSSRPKGTAPSKAQRAHERTLRSAIELYHLSSSFFPTPVQTDGFGALSSPPEPEPQAHARALDSVIRSSIQLVTDMEGEVRSRSKNLESVRPVLALRTGDLLEELEKPGSVKDGRAAGGPVYDPSRPPPLGNTLGSAQASGRDDRFGPDAERSLDRMFNKRTPRSSSSTSPNFLDTSVAPTARSQLRFTAPRHPTLKQAANQDALTLYAQHEEALRAAEGQRIKYVDPFVSQASPPSKIPSVPTSVLSALREADLLPDQRDGGSSATEGRVGAGVRGTSGTARMDRLDERSARVRDALFGTVAAELPGLEVLQERRRLRQLKEESAV
ncbi:hypothetical protein CF319_g3647 [Tilletia indica]|nr:hypothetical protein CF319_g3647 [Tilletia indica]